MQKGLSIISPVRNHILVCTDSLSSILALNDQFSSNSIIQDILYSIRDLKLKQITTVFCWIPSHIGIRENEEVDRLAKEAVTQGIQSNTITHRDLLGYAKSFIRNKWQCEWSLVSDNKLKEIKASVSPWTSSNRPNRREEVVISRLRIGHCRLTHEHLMTRNPQTICRHCGVNTTVKHIITECPAYEHQRVEYNIPDSLSEALNNSTSNLNNLVKFLKSINIYHLI